MEKGLLCAIEFSFKGTFKGVPLSYSPSYLVMSFLVSKEKEMKMHDEPTKTRKPF